MIQRLLLVTFLLLAWQCSPAPREESAAPASKASAGAASSPSDAGASEDDRPVIVAFGDSLTAGYGVRQGAAYPDYLQRIIDEGGYEYRVVNEGVSGDTSGAGFVRIESVLAHDPEIVIVAFGGNDGLRGLPVESMEENLRQIIARLQEAGADVVLAGMTLPPNYGKDYVEAFTSVYPRLAEELDVALVPFLLQGVAADPSLLHDDIHPNVKGNAIVAGVVMETLEPLLHKN